VNRTPPSSQDCHLCFAGGCDHLAHREGKRTVFEELRCEGIEWPQNRTEFWSEILEHAVYVPDRQSLPVQHKSHVNESQLLEQQREASAPEQMNVFEDRKSVV